jgi:hypothetical protein
VTWNPICVLLTARKSCVWSLNNIYTTSLLDAFIKQLTQQINECCRCIEVVPRVSARDCFGHNWFGRDPVVVVVVVVNQSRVRIFHFVVDELRSSELFLKF